MATAAQSYDPYAIPTRRMTQEELLQAAAYFGIEPTGLETEALRVEVKRIGEARWLEEHRAAIEAWKTWEAANESPLDRYRPF